MHHALQVSTEHASSGALPTQHFQHVVAYVSEPEAQAGLEPFLASCTFPQHVLQVPVGELWPAPAPELMAGPADTLRERQLQQPLIARPEIGAQSEPGKSAVLVLTCQ
jgi:hypothetical protein